MKSAVVLLYSGEIGVGDLMGVWEGKSHSILALSSLWNPAIFLREYSVYFSYEYMQVAQSNNYRCILMGSTKVTSHIHTSCVHTLTIAT